MAHNENKKTVKSAEKYAQLKENPPFALVESFRNLVTNIGFAVPKKADGKGKIICISSANAGEGKTTVSVNMAVSCADAGAKTIMIDCDMRKPKVRKYFSVGTQKGILEYLSGQAELGEVLSRGVSENLDVIVCKKVAPNPQALLKTEIFSDLLDKLASEYDYVIIDTPPLGIVSDALAIAELTDGIILVARQMVSRHPMLRQVVADIDFAGVNFLGFVLNDYSLKNAGKGYYKKYGYNYSEK